MDVPNRSYVKRNLSVRSLFISDLHLGFRHSQVEPLLKLLRTYEPEWLYIVGDFIDGWCVRKRWHWQPECSLVIQRLLELSRNGTRIHLAVGNHDNFLRTSIIQSLLCQNPGITVDEEFHHLLADGRRFLVMHGDQFDHCEQKSRISRWALSVCYEALLQVNRLWGCLTRSSLAGESSMISRFKAAVSGIQQHVRRFQSNLTRHARHRFCDGIICGHIHAPQVLELDGITYCNTGDWIESCSALIEDFHGQLHLIHADGKQRFLRTSGSSQS